MWNKKEKIFIIVMLVIAVVGLTIGFAAYQAVLNINTTAQVSPNSNAFKVFFSSSSTTTETNDIKPTVSGSNSTNIIANKASIDNSGTYPTISNLSAVLTEPGQKVEYNFYVRNDGQLEAFLTSIVLDGNSFKSCIGGDGTSDSLVAAACESITFTVKVGDTSVTSTTLGISGNSLLPSSSELVTVTIEYNSNGARADGPFEVYFGNVYVTYRSAETSELPTLPDNACILESGVGTNIGDQIACGDEHFYVVDSNDSTVTMLAAQNITLSTTPVQSSSAGTISFADSVYWDTTGYVYNSNSNLYPYVEAYEEYLKNDLNVTSASASLISSEILVNLGCSLNESGAEDSCPTSVSWIYSTKYWTGFTTNIYYYGSVDYINIEPDAGLGNGVYNCGYNNSVYDCALSYSYGIRPIITISRTELNKA